MSQHAVVVVESDDYLAKALAAAIELMLPVQAVVVDNPAQVMALVVAQSPKLVIVDVCTQRFNAFDIVAALKADQRSRNIPVIAMGPRGNQVHLARALGCADTLALPFRVAEVRRKVAKYVDVHLKEWPSRRPCDFSNRRPRLR